MSKLTDLTIAEALKGLEKGEFSATELTQAHIDAMQASKPLNCFIVETPELALEQAKASDERRAKGEARKLDGIPVAVKDLFCTEGVQTTAASKILEGFVPRYESTVTSNLLADGQDPPGLYLLAGLASLMAAAGGLVMVRRSRRVL